MSFDDANEHLVVVWDVLSTFCDFDAAPIRPCWKCCDELRSVIDGEPQRQWIEAL
jgi:hypothetical protein